MWAHYMFKKEGHTFVSKIIACRSTKPDVKGFHLIDWIVCYANTKRGKTAGYSNQRDACWTGLELENGAMLWNVSLVIGNQ